ncbi:MAG: DUF4912 domain-containing protein [Candidatus Omnitrophica bacterium]|nr:DUF4912 domain-containing protein [Candidatus Omnitrophota bacterium]
MLQTQINKKKLQNLNSTFKKIEAADTYDLPASYNQTYLTLIARDPFWIFAYWEITEDTLNQLKQKVNSKLDNGVFVIRMYDVTLIDFNGYNANRTFDIEIDPKANNWYINLWNDNATYCADLGFRLFNGMFFQLARSNFVTTPRFWLSNRKDEIWMEVKDNKIKPFVNVEVSAREELKSKKVASEEVKNPIHTENRIKRMRLSEADVKAYYSKLSPFLQELIAQRLARYTASLRYHKRGKREQKISLYNRGQILEAFPSDYVRKLFLGSSAEIFGGASEAIFSGASEQKQIGEQKRKFFFEIWTELIVYGRTEPTATVLFNNKKIQLNSDGTFRMQFALPDGKIPLEFIATSEDGIQKREISTEIERKKTKYNP